MKKLITSFMVLFFLIGAGTKSYGQAAGDYVFTQATDMLWATVGNWSISDGAGNLTVATRTPTATDNVWIPATKVMGTVGANASGNAIITAGSTSATLAGTSNTIAAGMAVKGVGIAQGTYVASVSGTALVLSQPAISSGTAVSLSYYPACKNLNVSGTFSVSAPIVAFGDITVNTGGILTQATDLYCANINNYGTFNATTGYSSGKSLYVGFNGAIPGTGDYTIVNDGIFGDTQPREVPQNGSGIRLWYSNQCNSFTVKPSSSAVNTYAFNIAAMLPHANIKTTANTNLNIKESMSLLLSSGICLSVQNNDTSANTTRTCSIDHGVTVYIGGKLHANGGVTSNDQGNFVYNVYGTLDLGTYTPGNSTANANSLDLCLSSYSGNTGSLTFNLGDGTLAKAGKLLIGSNVKIIKQKAQTIAINFNDNSTVEFNTSTNVSSTSVTTLLKPNYQLLNNNTPAPSLFPSRYYNLIINGPNVVLPVSPLVRGTRTYTTGGYAIKNWVAATGTTTASSSLYATQGQIIYTGSNYYYAPIVRSTTTYTGGNNPITIAGDTILQYIQPNQTISGGSGITATVSSLSGNSLQMSAAVASATTTQTNVTISFIGIQGTTEPTGTSTNRYSPVFDGTQGLIYLGGPEFATAAGYVPTAVNSPDANNVFVYSTEKTKLVIANAAAGDIATVYTVSGIKVASAKLTGDKTTLSIASGIYLVKINDSVLKVVVR